MTPPSSYNNLPDSKKQSSSVPGHQSDTRKKGAATVQQKDDDMTPRESLLWGITGGLLAAITGAFIWAEFTIIVEKDWAYDPQHAYMSILIGLIVGLSVRFLGKGRKPRFGVIAVLLAIVGCILGNVFSSIAYVVATLDLSYFTVITIFDLSQLWGFIADRFAYWDILFYSLALIFAYFFSVRGAIQHAAYRIEMTARHLLSRLENQF